MYQYHIECTKNFVTKDGEEKRVPHGQLSSEGSSKDDATVKKSNKKLSDFYLHRFRLNMRELLAAFIREHPSCFGEKPDRLCYDYDHTIFSLDPLKMIDVPLILSKHQSLAVIGRPCVMELVVREPKDNVFSITDFATSFTSDLAEKDTNIIRFLELATSRYAGENE